MEVLVTRTLLGTLDAPQVHVEPVVARVAVRHHAQSVVIDVDAAELAQPLTYFLNGGGPRSKRSAIQNEHP